MGFYRHNRKELVPPKYDDVSHFEEGLAAVELNGKWGFIDRSGKEVVPPKYDFVAHFEKDGLAEVRLNGKWGFIDRTGKEILGLAHTRINQSYRRDYRYRCFSLNGKNGFILVKDKENNEYVIIPAGKYDHLRSYLQLHR